MRKFTPESGMTQERVRIESGLRLLGIMPTRSSTEKWVDRKMDGHGESEISHLRFEVAEVTCNRQVFPSLIFLSLDFSVEASSASYVSVLCSHVSAANATTVSHALNSARATWRKL